MGRGITVYTNDPDRPKVFLKIKANVLASVRVFPSDRARIDNRRKQLSAPALLVRKDLTESGTLEIDDLRSSAEWLTVSSRRLEGGAVNEGLPEAWTGDWLLELAVNDPPAYGHSQQTVRFKTGLPREPEVEIPVQVNLAPPVNLTADRLVLEGREPDGARSGTIRLTVRRGLDPTELGVESEPSTIEVDLEPNGGRHFSLHVRWSGDGRREGTVRISVGAESVRLPVLLGP